MNNNNSVNNFENVDIDLKEFLGVFWDNKSKILIASALTSAVLLVYSLFLPNIYQSSMLLKVEDEKGSTGGMSSIASQYGSLANLAGISIPSEGDSKAQYAIEVIKSKEFLKYLLTFEDVKINLVAVNGYNKIDNSLKYDKKIYDIDKNTWIKSPSFKNQQEPSYLEVYEDFFIDKLRINHDKISNFIDITFEHPSPIFAYELLNLIYYEINNLTRMKDIDTSNKSIEYLEDRLSETQQKEIIQLINSLISSQLKVQMLATTRDDYILSIIDKPYVPEKESSPSRWMYSLFGIFFGLFISSLFFVTRYYLYKK